MQKKSSFWGRKKQNVHEFCVFGRYLLRKSIDFLNISIFFANFVNRNNAITGETKNEVY